MATKNGPFEGKVAIVTGSSSGIGAAIAYEFASKGAKLVLNARTQEQLEQVADNCYELSPATNKVKPLLVIGDITDASIREKLINETITRFGQLDILVNNAGNFSTSTLFSGTDIEDLDKMLDIHVRAPFHLTKLATEHLVKSKGNIVNISSRASFKPVSLQGVEYSIAKCLLDQLTKWTALELSPKGVRANSVNPGSILTDIGARAGRCPEEVKQWFDTQAKVHALGRVGKTEEVAKAVAFLASEDASFVSGENLLVDGGNSVVPALPPGTPYII